MTTRRSVRVGISFGLAAVAMVVSATVADARRNLYATGFTSSRVAAFDLDASGAPSPITGSPFTTGTGPRGISITPDGAHAYVANETDDTVTPFNISAIGGLTPVGAAKAVGDAPRAVAVSADGRHVYVSNSGAGAGGASVSALALNADGSLETIPGSPFPAGTTPQGIALTPNGQFLWVANRGSANLSAYSVGANGGLTPLVPPTVAVGNEPRGVSITPDGNHLYVANFASSTVSAFSIGADGTLTPVGAPTPTGTNPDEVTITPDGAFLYTVNEATDNISVFAITAGSGALTPLSPATSGDQPTMGAVTPDGAHFYNSNFAVDTISGFDIGADGSLTGISGTPFPGTVVASGFLSLAITPDQGPTASFPAVAVAAGSPASFNGHGSTDPDGTVARYDWDFGDGQSLADGGPEPSHTYATAGTYTATLTVTDNEGCSSKLVFTGHIVLCNGGAKAVAQQQVQVNDTTAPVVTATAKKHQKLGGAIKVTGECSEPCELTAAGVLHVHAPAAKLAKNAKFDLRATGNTGANEPKKLRLKLPKPAKTLFKNPQAKGKAKIRVTGRDAAGNREFDIVKVRVKSKQR